MSLENNTPEMEEEYEADLVVLLDDDGKQIEFEVIDEVENDDGYFLAMVPTEPNPDAEIADVDEYYIFEVVVEDGEEHLYEVEDGPLMNKLEAIFEARFAEFEKE